MGFLFCNHFTFYLSYLGMNYSNVIGFLITMVFLLQFMSGLLLSCYYTPMIAFSSMYYIMIDVNKGWLIRFLHILGASMFMVLVVVHWMRGIWMKLKMVEQNTLSLAYCIKLNTLNLIWVSGLVILLFTFLTSFIGYCVCWGQMSYWGITVMINIPTIMPLFGFYIGEYLWCSSLTMMNSLFMLHFLLGFMIGLLMLCHLMILHNFSSCNPLMNTMLFMLFFMLYIDHNLIINFVVS